MSRPTGHTSTGEQRSEQILRNAQHGVHEAGIHVHVRAHILPCALLVEDNLGRQALDLLKQAELGLEFSAHSQLLGEALANNGTRIGQRVNCMTHAVDQAALVISLFVHDLRKICRNLVIVFPIDDVVLDLLLHG